MQRHLFPSLVTLQVEFGHSLQSLEELQLGSCGVSQLIFTSASMPELKFMEALNGNDRLSCRYPLEFLALRFSACLTCTTNVRVVGSILATR
jgi:hypothetical protein